MIQRFLGNKTAMLEHILECAYDLQPPPGRVCDIFSGSVAVSMAFKDAGYDVISNDINLFSGVIGKAYLQHSKIPSINLRMLVPQKASQLSEPRSRTREEIEALIGRHGFSFLEKEGHLKQYLDFLLVLRFLEVADINELPSRGRYSCIFDCYCEDGRYSEYTSARGRTGRRRYFTANNAKRIDTILSFLRYWYLKKRLNLHAYYCILAALVRAVEKVSNTQGTYHDFPRTEWDSRALNELTFEPPSFDVVLRGGRHRVGLEQDSLRYIRQVPDHDILYIDPPYNFRQYTAYYFLLNDICRFCTVKSPRAYFAEIEYVRGQNMRYDFSSSFCSKRYFIGSLEELIAIAPATHVVLSYFDGRNHWNEFDSTSNGNGYEKMKLLFTSSLFKPKSLRIVPIERMNYQSYGGFKSRRVTEYLFIGQKRVSRAE